MLHGRTIVGIYAALLYVKIRALLFSACSRGADSPPAAARGNQHDRRRRDYAPAKTRVKQEIQWSWVLHVFTGPIGWVR